MKRSKFLSALAAMLTLPLFSFSKKEKKIPEPWIIRESILIDTDTRHPSVQNYYEDIVDIQQRAKIAKAIQEKVKVWDTGSIGRDGKHELWRHYMIVILPQENGGTL